MFVALGIDPNAGADASTFEVPKLDPPNAKDDGAGALSATVLPKFVAPPLEDVPLAPNTNSLVDEESCDVLLSVLFTKEKSGGPATDGAALLA